MGTFEDDLLKQSLSKTPGADQELPEREVTVGDVAKSSETPLDYEHWMAAVMSAKEGGTDRSQIAHRIADLLQPRDPKAMSLDELVDATELATNISKVSGRVGRAQFPRAAEQAARFGRELDSRMDEAVINGRGRKISARDSYLGKGLTKTEWDELELKGYQHIGSSAGDTWIFNPKTPEAKALKRSRDKWKAREENKAA